MSNKTIIFILLFLTGYGFSSAQKHDFNWVLGTSPFAGDLLNFKGYSLNISLISKTVPFNITNSTISSTSGEYVLSFNGWGIQDRGFSLMENSDSLFLGSIPALYHNSGAPFIKGSIALPSQKDTNILLLIYWDFRGYSYMPDTPSVAPFHLYMAKIDKSGNGGLGKVIKKNILLIADTLANAGITATKHANGRDWWVVVPEIVSNRYHTLLISNDIVAQSYSQPIGVFWPPFVDITSSSIFNNSGTKYYRFSDQIGLQIFEFDRCTGLFFNPKLLPYEFNNDYFFDFAISRDDRFLYLSSINNLYQYDLNDSAIASTKLLLDTYDGFMNPPSWPCNFRFPQLAPDGKVYIGSYGGCKNLHVINHPERKGLECGFQQHAIKLNTFHKGGLPNMPNYRLGPIDGSICDSLGLDNIPLAGFRYDKYSADFLKIEYTDLSDYEPENWVWDFGDGQSSVEQYPTHQYDSVGIYEVCLTVSNQNGSDTYCKTLQLNTSVTIEDVPEGNLVFYDFGNVQLMIRDIQMKSIKIFDVSGRIIKNIYAPSSSFVDMSDLKSGLYFWQAFDHNGRLQTGKFVKI